MSFRCALAVSLVALMVAWISRAEAEAATHDIAKNTCIETGGNAQDALASVGKALVIGNAAYSNGIPALKNPLNDAKAVSNTLVKLGFTVFLAADASASTIQDCVTRMTRSITDRDVALFYYSGHGIQIDDRNYLVAVDAATDGDISKGYVYIDDIIDGARRKADTVLVFLDACRNNPFAREDAQGLSVSTGRGIERGLKRAEGDENKPGEQQGRGIFVAYSTSPNAVASDGAGDLSPFTEAFVTSIGKPGYSVQRALADVSRLVGEATNWGQTPWLKSSLTGEVKLNGTLTLEEAVSISENFAAKAEALIRKGDLDGAVSSALQGLPARLTPAGEKRFASAYVMLGAALGSSSIRLPIPAGGYPYIAASADNGRAVVSGKGRIELWDTKAKRRIAELGTHAADRFPITPLFSPSGARVAFSTGAGKVMIADSLTGKIVQTFETPTPDEFRQITYYAFSPDERRLVLSVNDTPEAIQLWSIDDGRKLFGIDLAWIQSHFAATKTWAAYSGFAGSASDGRTLGFLALAPNSDGRMIFGRLDLASKKLVASGTHHFKRAIYPQGFSLRTDGTRALLHYFDGDGDRIGLIDVSQGGVLSTMEANRGQFSPAGDRFAAITQSGTRVFSAENGTLIADFSGMAGHVLPGAFDEQGNPISLGVYNSMSRNLAGVALDLWREIPDGQARIEAGLMRLGSNVADVLPLDFRSID
mgnify:CR=1 FL=1